MCVLFYSSFVYTCVCVFLRIQSPLRGCRSIRSSASGLPADYCAPIVCISVVIRLLSVWRLNKPQTKKTKNQSRKGLRMVTWNKAGARLVGICSIQKIKWKKTAWVHHSHPHVVNLDMTRSSKLREVIYDPTERKKDDRTGVVVRRDPGIAFHIGRQVRDGHQGARQAEGL